MVAGTTNGIQDRNRKIMIDVDYPNLGSSTSIQHEAGQLVFDVFVKQIVLSDQFMRSYYKPFRITLDGLMHILTTDNSRLSSLERDVKRQMVTSSVAAKKRDINGETVIESRKVGDFDRELFLKYVKPKFITSSETLEEGVAERRGRQTLVLLGTGYPEEKNRLSIPANLCFDEDNNRISTQTILPAGSYYLYLSIREDNDQPLRFFIARGPPNTAYYTIGRFNYKVVTKQNPELLAYHLMDSRTKMGPTGETTYYVLKQFVFFDCHILYNNEEHEIIKSFVNGSIKNDEFDITETLKLKLRYEGNKSNKNTNYLILGDD